MANYVCMYDFFLFPKLKTLIKGKRFATIEEINEKSKEELLAIPKSAFQLSVSTIGKNAGRNVLFLRGFTLRIVIDK